MFSQISLFIRYIPEWNCRYFFWFGEGVFLETEVNGVFAGSQVTWNQHRLPTTLLLFAPLCKQQLWATIHRVVDPDLHQVAHLPDECAGRSPEPTAQT